jgi:iron-sulfur cluster-binding protein
MSLKLSNDIKAEAKRLGFFACGIAKAAPVEPDTAAEVVRWLDNECFAEMAYMNNYTDKRLNPQLLMPGLKSIVCVAMSYAPAQRMPEGQYQLASYAYGQDYHEVVKGKLRQLAAHFGFEPYIEESVSPSPSVAESPPRYRVFCDSAPILERYWAVKAGLGWTGRNHQLIIPKAGSMFVLGELFLDIELNYDEEMPNRCGNCHKCIDVCPTKALGTWQDIASKKTFLFDARRCLSYQTIEYRGDLNPEVAQAMGDTIYGCDKCQTICPWNAHPIATNIEELAPKAELMSMTREQWHNLTEDDYRRLFKGSAVKRAKYTGLMRNIKAVEQCQNQQKQEENDVHEPTINDKEKKQ